MNPGDLVMWNHDYDSQRRFMVRHVHADGSVSVVGSDEGQGRLPADELTRIEESNHGE